MRKVYLTTAGQLADYLEKQIAAGRNPKTEEQWTEFFDRMDVEESQASVIAVVGDDFDSRDLERGLRERGHRVIKPGAQVINGKNSL